MNSTHRPTRWGALAAVGVLTASLVAAIPAHAAEPDDLVGSTLYLNPHSTTLEAAQSLTGQARADAQLLGSIPAADWYTKGTPDEIRAAVDKVVTAADAAGQMPILVAYNLPFRDCAQYSSGGAADTAEYAAWIDAFAEGIGDRAATVLVEPDGLGIIPHYTNLEGSVEWCQPAEIDASIATSERFAQLNHAVDAFSALERTSVYLDGTSSAWLTVDEISDRLIKAGVEKATGFFLNASNYQFTENNIAYGTWVSSCIAYVTEVAPGDLANCGNQYWNGGPATDWQGVAMSQYGRWSPDAADPTANTAGLDSRYEAILGGVEPTTRFVIDTSRNALGPWQYPAGVYPAHEDWCNPPDRGAGVVPTTSTGVDLVDAYLWIKRPGESDGTCLRGTAGPLDPARGVVDPPAGQWFPAQARELIALASPALPALTCHVRVVGTKVGRGFVAAVSVENRGTTTLKPWKLSWEFSGDQRVKKVVGGSFTQSGVAVTVTAPKVKQSLAPGKKTALVVTGVGSAQVPWQFRLNGRVCTS